MSTGWVSTTQLWNENPGMCSPQDKCPETQFSATPAVPGGPDTWSTFQTLSDVVLMDTYCQGRLQGGS